MVWETFKMKRHINVQITPIDIWKDIKSKGAITTICNVKYYWWKVRVLVDKTFIFEWLKPLHVYQYATPINIQAKEKNQALKKFTNLLASIF